MSGKAPNFFILGAPKCGTTSLALWLTDHPQVYISPIKEPHFYSTDLANRTVRIQKRYDNLFREAESHHRAVGEASTWYLYSQEAVSAIEKAHPGARYIVMTRDPVEMAHSLYHHNYRVLHEDQPTFEAAWLLQEERAMGRHIPKSCTEQAFLQYRAACSLGLLLERLYDRVPESRVLHVPLEWMQNDPSTQYQRTLAFLDLPLEQKTDFRVANEARGHRSAMAQRVLRMGSRARMALGLKRGTGLAMLNDRARPKQSLEEKFLCTLTEAFKHEQVLLKRFIDRIRHT